MSDQIRKLAEEIAANISRAVQSTFRVLGHEGYSKEALDRNVAADADAWEARLRSALPELSGVLGELAVAQEALVRLLMHGDEDGTHLPTDAEDQDREFARSALSSDSGRLAGEALRVWIRFHLGTGPNHMEVDPLREPSEATAALLAAFPALREEVERG